MNNNKNKKYFIGFGSSTLATFDSVKEMHDYFDKMKMPDKHFCRLYDLNKKRDELGCVYQYRKPHQRWRDTQRLK